MRASSSSSAAVSGGVICRSMRGSPSSTEMVRAIDASVASPSSAICWTMCPPLRDRARLITASCPRSSSSCSFCSRSMIVPTST